MVTNYQPGSTGTGYAPNNPSPQGVGLATYADWATNEVLSRPPEIRLAEDWIPNWGRTLGAIANARGIHELMGIICSRWEFLGRLYLGRTGDTGVEEAIAYADEFLLPINNGYRQLHNMSGRAQQPGKPRSDFITMFRTKPIHSGTPAAVALPGSVSLIGWWVGFFDEVTRTKHLQVSDGAIWVDGGVLLDEFILSLRTFAYYLQHDNDLLDGHSPRQRWQRGFWASFKPIWFPEQDWIKEGVTRGIPS